MCNDYLLPLPPVYFLIDVYELALALVINAS